VNRKKLTSTFSLMTAAGAFALMISMNAGTN
jgi:hypothetical protein